jgi:hypothetical protein
MKKPIIEVNNLSKQYAIGERADYGSLREEKGIDWTDNRLTTGLY